MKWAPDNNPDSDEDGFYDGMEYAASVQLIQNSLRPRILEWSDGGNLMNPMEPLVWTLAEMVEMELSSVSSQIKLSG